MARKRMVTRTVIETTANVMCVDVTTAQVVTTEYRVQGTFTSKDECLIALKKRYEDDVKKLVSVITMDEQETLYGMEENLFIQLAQVLPPRVIKKEEDTEEG